MIRKGLLAHIHRSNLGARLGYPLDLSVRSNTVHSIIVVGAGLDQVFDERKDCPAYELVQHVRGCVSLVPIDGALNKRQVIGPMASGNFATGDGRFSEAVRRLLGHGFSRSLRNPGHLRRQLALTHRGAVPVERPSWSDVGRASRPPSLARNTPGLAGRNETDMSINTSTITIKYDPTYAVPSEPAARVAWLERHGVMPREATLTVTLSLRDWLRVRAEISADATAREPSYKWEQPRIYDAMEKAAQRLVAETGTVVTELPQPILAVAVHELARAWDAYEAKQAKEEAEAKEAKAKKAEAEAEAKRVRIADLVAAGVHSLLKMDKDGKWDEPNLGEYTMDCASAAFGSDYRDLMRAERDRRNEEISSTRAAVTAAWIREYGTPSQKARHDEGVLPEAELLDAVRDWAFAPFTDWLNSYDRITASDIEHHDECEGDDCEFSVGVLDEMTEAEYGQLLLVRQAAATAPLPLVIEARYHKGWCDGCPGEDMVERSSVRITATWGGRKISREYAL